MKFLFKNYPILLIVVSFAPYLSISTGLKYEDFLVYGTVMLVLLYVVITKKIRINKSMLGILLAWLSLVIYLILRTLIGGGGENVKSLLADFNNLLQPLSVILLFTIITQKLCKNRLLGVVRIAGKTLLFLLICNTLWLIFGFIYDTTPINIHFWGGENSTALKAAQNSRFSGIFNQPVEAGMAYSLGLLVWLYLVGKRYISTGIKSISTLILIFIGGSITVSKVFVVIGVALFIIGVFYNKRIRKRILPISLLFIVLGYPLFKYLTDTWSGLKYLTRLFSWSNYQTEGFLNMLTAGRYGGENSQQSNLFQEVWRHSPVLGEGLGSQPTFDSSHFFFFSTGGIIGLLFYAIMILALFWMVYEYYVYCGINEEFKLFLGIIILLVIGGLGAPTLTLNRSSLLIWVFIGLLLHYLCILKMIRAGNLDKNSEPESQIISGERKRRNLIST